MNEDRLRAAERLMDQFAARTGLDGIGDPGRRYLWTDAFAVLAFLGLYRRTGSTEHLERAMTVVDLVHAYLGRHRSDDSRAGWISGLGEFAGARRPTAGGLRIGKPLPERGILEAFDGQVEWERDGQYFHYLTKWMHALNRMSLATGDPQWNRFAVDLALVSHATFVHEPHPGGPKRMFWKMSIDLSRPLVRSMGHLDPLDGYTTLATVRAAERRHDPSFSALDGAIADMHRMCGEVRDWSSGDPLGIGGLLAEASMLDELVASGEVPPDPLLDRIRRDALRGLEAFVARDELLAPASDRLAFRELGLAIGLQAVGADEAFTPYLPIVDAVESSWRSPVAQSSIGWIAHQDINSVMLATSLVPDAITSTWEHLAAGRPACA
jgi:hypothetical protein